MDYAWLQGFGTLVGKYIYQWAVSFAKILKIVLSTRTEYYENFREISLPLLLT